MEYLLKPGLGVGSLRLGDRKSQSERDTESSREGYAKRGLWYAFDNAGAISEIIVTSREYATDRQIRIGSSVKDVRAAYGSGTEGKMN